MRTTAISSLAFVLASLAFGCAAPEQDSAPDQLAEQSQQALTLSECAAQRTSCFNKNPLFGLFTCPAQYTQCAATASNGLPAEVTSAIADVADCTREALACVDGATGVTDAAVCAENEAQCVAIIVGVELPDVVEGTAGCVDGGVECIRGAREVEDLAACAESLSICAVEQVQAVVPRDVGQVVGKVNDCRLALDSCIAEAGSAADVTVCTEASASCVAATLDVTLPEVPVSEVVGCAETAASCALQVSSLREVTECAAGLRSCAENVVANIDVPQQLTCEQKWTACMAANPFNFFKCSAELGGCQD